ncbi:MAG: N-ATPase subunit AtpR [Desulfobulbales bacterium]
MNSESLILGAVWGTILGLFYFGGLWFTVCRVQKIKRPQRFLLVSFLLRLSVLLPCFWLVLKHDLILFGITLLFFLLIRFMIPWLLDKSDLRGLHAD